MGFIRPHPHRLFALESGRCSSSRPAFTPTYTTIVCLCIHVARGQYTRIILPERTTFISYASHQSSPPNAKPLFLSDLGPIEGRQKSQGEQPEESSIYVTLALFHFDFTMPNTLCRTPSRTSSSHLPPSPYLPRLSSSCSSSFSLLYVLARFFRPT